MSSTFLTQEPKALTLDTRPKPDVAAYYSGDTTDVPVLEQGMIVLKGAKVNRPANKGAYFGIPFNAIENGGNGVRLRCCVTPTKQRLRFFCESTSACTNPGKPVMSILLKPRQTDQRAYKYDYEIPAAAYKVAGCVESCCQLLYALRDEFNYQYDHLGVASVVQIGSDYALDIETKYAGDVFDVRAYSGLKPPVLVVPGNDGGYYSNILAPWFGGTDVPVECGQSVECLRAAELFVDKKFASGHIGAATSNLSASTDTFTMTSQTVTILFANNDNATAARTALINILDASNDQYRDKLISSTCEDRMLYPYTIVKTDAGTSSAYDAAKTAYSAAVQLLRYGYKDGKSTYVIYTASATAPTAVGSDVVSVGTPVPADNVFTSPCS